MSQKGMSKKSLRGQAMRQAGVVNMGVFEGQKMSLREPKGERGSNRPPAETVTVTVTVRCCQPRRRRQSREKKTRVVNAYTRLSLKPVLVQPN